MVIILIFNDFDETGTIFFFLIVVMPFPPNSPTLSGSLTTLLIAHLATLELGDHLESYVALTGLLRLHSRHFFYKVNFSGFYTFFQWPTCTL